MAFLFPKLFPACVQEGGFNVSLSLENAMAMYWKATALELVASCSEDGKGFSTGVTLTAEHTLDQLICGGVATFRGTDQFGINRVLDVGPGAYKQGELYIPYLSGQFVLSGFEASRLLLITTESNAGSSPISFQDQSIGGLFFNDDPPPKILSGSGSLTIVAERTFN